MTRPMLDYIGDPGAAPVECDRCIADSDDGPITCSTTPQGSEMLCGTCARELREGRNSTSPVGQMAWDVAMGAALMLREELVG